MKHKRRLSHGEFKVMQAIMKLVDLVRPYVPGRAETFGIARGMTVVDYGCGPGRYTAEFARLSGAEGKVYAVDLLEIALRETEKRLKKRGVNNVALMLAKGYDSGVPDGVADIVCAVDMFHHVEEAPFLKEAYRIAKRDGTMLISGGHQSRSSIKKSVADSGLWELTEENKTTIKFKKLIT